MKRVTISMPDSVHEELSLYASERGVSFSKACVHLSAIGIASMPAEHTVSEIMESFHDNNIHHFMTGNFTVPSTVIYRSIYRSITGKVGVDPLVEFSEIVGS